MNIVDKSKMCPRCRFTLSKTHSQKMICKRCGYTSNKLQIVQEQDAYDANIRFSRRVNINKSTPKQQTQSTQNVLEKYLKQFQWLLRQVGRKFFNDDQRDNLIHREKLTYTYKNLWFAYLQKMAKEGNVISGVFNAIAEKSNKKNEKKGTLKQQQQKSEQSDNGSGSQQQQNQKKQQKSEEDENSQRNGQKPKQSKRGLQEDDEDKQQKSSKQKQSNKDLGFVQYKRIINKVTKQIKSLKQPTLTSLKQVFKKQLIPQFFQIAQSKIQNSSFESIVYLAQKYVWFLSFLKQFKGNKKQRPKLQSLINNKWVRQEDLRAMCQERGIQYEKRKLYSQIIVFLYDLLIWSFQQTHKDSVYIFDRNETYPYPFLLSLYKNESKKVPLIEKVIKIVQQMSEQAMIKLEESQKKVPQLSFKFICALIYIASVLNKKCNTVLQVVNAAINILQEIVEENIATQQVQKRQLLILLVKQKNINVRRVRKMAHQVFRFIQNGNFTIECSLNLSGWCQKFIKTFNLPIKTANQFKLLTQTLYKGHIQQIESTFRRNTSSNNYYVHSSVPQRFILLEQPEVVLSSLLVYLKLKFGLDKGQYPYLINIYEVWNSLKQNKMLLKEDDVQKLEFLEKIFKEYNVCDLQGELSLLKLLHNVNQSVRRIDSYQGLKSISEKSINKLAQKIRKFRQINGSKEQNKLYLMHGAGNMNENQQKKVVKVQFIKDRKEEEVPQLFRYKQFKKKVQLTSIVERSIDYLFEKHKRFIKNKEITQNQPEVLDQPQGEKEFEILNYIDHPSSNYEIIYHPTINSLYQLKLTQLLVIVEALSLVINGQYTDCKDLLQWMGFLQTALRQFQ